MAGTRRSTHDQAETRRHLEGYLEAYPGLRGRVCRILLLHLHTHDHVRIEAAVDLQEPRLATRVVENVLDPAAVARLPEAGELETLLDRSGLLDATRYRPSMRKEIPFRDALAYWSSTTFGENRNSAWIVMFDGAYVLSYNKRNRYHVRCVRGYAFQ